MKRDFRILIALSINALFFFVLNQINTFLQTLQIHLTMDAFYIVLPVFYFGVYSGLCVVAISAFLAYTSVPIVTVVCLIFVTIFLLAVQFRQKINRESGLHLTLYALISNAVIMLTITFIAARSSCPTYWTQALINLGFSELAIALLTTRYVQFQRQLFLTLRIDLGAELQDI
jgi:hypothetical protein